MADGLAALVQELVRHALREELAPLVAAIESLQRQQATAELPPWVSVRRAAELTGVSVATVRRQLREGGKAKLNARKVRGRVLVETASLFPADPTTVARLASEARA